MTNDSIEPALDRRLLLRGGAVLAGAAGAAVIGSALATTPAQAGVPPYLVEGGVNESEDTTSIIIDGPDGGLSPALALSNPSGPSLLLTPVGDKYDGNLQLGEIANTENGPDIGVKYGSALRTADIDTQTTWLATGLDLDQIPFNLPLPPERLLDTRTEEGREAIQSSSPDAFDSSNRLQGGAWMDVSLAPDDYFGLLAAFVNITVVSPLVSGYVTVYPPGDRPRSSTVNFSKGQTIANGAFIATDVVENYYVIRLFSTATTHLVVDLTGVSILGTSGTSAKVGQRNQRNAAKANRMKRVFR